MSRAAGIMIQIIDPAALFNLFRQIFFDQIDRRDVYMAEHISAVFL